MKVEIRHIKNLETPGDLLETVAINASVIQPDDILAIVGAALINNGLKTFGENAQMVNNETIFGGHVRNRLTGEAIIAV